jgi:AraC family transcriptional regulator, activator of mtrCDE
MRDETFNRIIESLHVKYYKAGMREVVRPAELHASLEPRNILIQVNSGYCYGENNYSRIKPGDFYFMPVGSPIFLRHGRSNAYATFGAEGFNSSEQREQYVRTISCNEQRDEDKDVFSIMGFDAQVYGAIPFFAILEMPCIIIPFEEEMNYLMHTIVHEEEDRKLGRERLLRNLSDELVVHICRYIGSRPEYKKNFEKINFLLDKRLVNIIQYIQTHLQEDLTNQKISEIAYVSKDYVGQFFKSMTNTNLQDYIENQRLEKAHSLLRTTQDNVQEIAHNVGFKDPAYFSRRFKIKFKKNANQIRKEESLVV